MNYSMMHHLSLAVVTAGMLIASPLHASDTDDFIEASFKESYVYRTYLQDDSVKIDSENGVVTLRGTVASESNKHLAEDTASGLNGVVRVVSEIETEEEVAAEKSDTWIERKIQFALLVRRNVSFRATEVSVDNGVVTLTGEADNLAQKELTGEYAADIDGVKSVVNQMTLSATPEKTERTRSEEIDDASVTAQVKLALKSHRSTRTADIDVVTRDGTVTLTGVAANNAEKALVTKTVSDIQGVDKVNNEMTLRPNDVH
ncbi:MAG: BON domain-containing protein [Verrucomicrobia bacterium]|nr:BON domain-containing protein [Verrucomicrobiota bacterium]MCH8527319.1 BON domain-containing protein [Kiritimatiellia bacterium]